MIRLMVVQPAVVNKVFHLGVDIIVAAEGLIADICAEMIQFFFKLRDNVKGRAEALMVISVPQALDVMGVEELFEGVFNRKHD